MKRITALSCMVVAAAALVATGCGQHVEKKHETLVSPSMRGTEAQKEPEGRSDYGEPTSDTKP